MTTLVDNYLADLIARVAEGLDEIMPTDWRVLGYLDVLAGGKYICIWDQGGSYDVSQTEEWVIKAQRLGLLLVAGVAGSGFDGDLDRLLTGITPTFELAIFELLFRQLTTGTAGHEEPPNYVSNDPTLSPDSGRQGIEHSNIGGRVIAKTFVLEVPIRIPTEIT